MCVVKRDGKVVIIDQSDEIDSLITGLENAVQAVRLSGDKISGLRLRIMELEATLIDCKAEYLLLLDENPNTFAWDFDELSREDQDRYRKDARDGLQIEEPIISIQLREAEARIAELEAQVATLKTIAIDERDEYNNMLQEYCDGEFYTTDDARRQLAEEHPEIFGD